MTPRFAGLLLAFLVAAPRPGSGQSTDLATYVLFGSASVVLGGDAHVVGGDLGSNGSLTIGSSATVAAPSRLAADRITLGQASETYGDIFVNDLQLRGPRAVGPLHSPVTLPILAPPGPPVVVPGSTRVLVPRGTFWTLAPGAYGEIRSNPGSVLIFANGTYDVESLVVRGSRATSTEVRCGSAAGCTVRVRERLLLGASCQAPT